MRAIKPSLFVCDTCRLTMLILQMKKATFLAGLLFAIACHAEGENPEGFFRIKRAGDRWCLVDPEGKRFFSIGVAKVDPKGYWCPALEHSPYNRSILERNESEEQWVSKTLSRLKEWDFNTLGAWSATGLLAAQMPYTLNLNLSPADWQTGEIPDFWSRKFFDHVDQVVRREVIPRANDPKLMGYFFGNELRWGPDWRGQSDFFASYLALPAHAPGKVALVDWLRQRYRDDPAAFNGAWGMEIERFEDILSMEALPESPVTGKSEADRRAFTGYAARQFFRTCHDAIRAVDPNHLLLGVRFVSWVTPLEAVRAISDYTDVVSVNHYPLQPVARLVILELGRRLGWLDPEGMLIKFHEATNRPVLISEFSFRADDSNLPNTWPPGWLFPVLKTQADRAEHYERFARSAFTRDYIVGYHWFSYMDQPAAGRFDGENSNFGLVGNEDRPWSALIERVKTVNREALQKRAGFEFRD